MVVDLHKLIKVEEVYDTRAVGIGQTVKRAGCEIIYEVWVVGPVEEVSDHVGAFVGSSSDESQAVRGRDVIAVGILLPKMFIEIDEVWTDLLSLRQMR